MEKKAIKIVGWSLGLTAAALILLMLLNMIKNAILMILYGI